jgi:hypothetical protein
MAPVRIAHLTLLVTLLAFGFAGAVGCAAKPARHEEVPVASQLDALAVKLAACRISELATGLAMDPQVADIWRAMPKPEPYATLIEDPHRPMRVRFAAALVLRSGSIVDFQKVNPRTMAQVFAAALHDDLAGYAFPWGSLWASKPDAVGLLGQVFVEIGKPAEPALGALLDDDSARDVYLGRDVAADMARRQYRVKDFAAFYLARIAKLDLRWEADLARRDEAIDQLRRQLPELPAPAVRGITSNAQVDKRTRSAL